MEKSMEKQCKNRSLETLIPLILMVISVVISCRVNAQRSIPSVDNKCISEEDKVLKDSVYITVDKQPVYPEGEIGLLNFISSNFRLSDQEVDAELSFKTQFVINEEGLIVGQRIKNKSAQELTAAEKEILRVLGTMPKWRPGECNNKSVKVKIDLPIAF